jgi:hypothetical protein
MTQADSVHSTPPTNTPISQIDPTGATSRRRFLSQAAGVAAGSSVLALAVIPPAPAVAAPTGLPDPILAAIEAHKAADSHFADAMRRHCALDEELPAHLCKSSITAWETSIVETDDPRWILAEVELDRASSAETAAATNLANVKPTTLEGLRALAEHACERERRRAAWPDDLEDDNGNARSWHFFILENFAAALASSAGLQAVAS